VRGSRPRIALDGIASLEPPRLDRGDVAAARNNRPVPKSPVRRRRLLKARQSSKIPKAVLIMLRSLLQTSAESH
jgi:hypothetical protein